MAMDVNKEIRRAVDTGRVVFGSRQSEKSILGGKAQLVILGSNTPKDVAEKIRHLAAVWEIPFYGHEKTGIALGSVCGKPFVISVMAIEKTGKSNILDALKEAGEKSEGKTPKKKGRGSRAKAGKAQKEKETETREGVGK